MGSNSKLQKLSYGEDRISNLPDPILIQILSLLPTKSAACTTILSKRWKFLFISLPNLDFEDSISVYHEFFGYNPRQKLSIMNFVDRILMSRENDLNLVRFSLNCSGNYDLIRVDEWIRLAIRHKVKEINLTLNFRELYKLVRDVYMCRTVEVFRVSWKILIDVPERVSFTALKVLEFDRVKFSSYESVEKILLECPVLEDLLIRSCEWLDGCRLNICGSALKNISLHSNGPINEEVELKISIDAPALETLCIKEYTSENIIIKTNLLSLETANIDVSQTVERVVPSSVYGDSVFGLLKMISHVKFLTLSERTLGALSCASDYSFPTFHNLTELELFVDGWSGWTLLPNILASSPYLVNLVFPRGLVQSFYSQLEHFRFSWNPPELVPECLSLHLETIKIRDFRGIAEELTLVKYFLKHGRVMRTMSIDCSLVRKDENIQKKLIKFRRGSTTCRLDLTS